MKTILEKLNYKGQKRIALINADESFYQNLMKENYEIQLDDSIDPRFPYSFMIIFVKKVSDIRLISPAAIHNLTVDGLLWYCYPKKTSKKYKSDIDRDHGWKSLNDSGFFVVRVVSVDDNWSAIRFRNIKYIRTKSERFKIKKV